MNFKKKVSGSWTDTPHYIHNTSTDTITTLPAVIHPTGTTATVGLKGNTLQSSIPSPTSPVMPQGTGERTGNLFDMSFYEGKSGITVSGNKATGTCDRFFNAKLSIPPELYGQELTWSAYLKRPDNPSTARLQTADNGSYKYGNNITGEGHSTVSFTATSTIKLYVNYANTGSDTIELSDITLNLGSTALPYEPYGYKIPISSAGQTNNSYLGDVQTTRKIKKVVFDGTEEGWEKSATSTRAGCFVLKGFGTGITEKAMYCTHATYVNTVSQLTSSNTCYMGNDFNIWLDLFNAQTTTEQFKDYLAQQYAAGTPVTVWYVLATEETGIVNEPLMKIGDYADTVSGITIPTISGKDTFDVETTLKPSEVELTYAGWHDATVKLWDGSQWQ